MKGSGFRLPFVCLVGLGVVACSAAGDDASVGKDGDPSLVLDAVAPRPSEDRGDQGQPGHSDIPPADDESDPEPPPTHCECADDVPGIDIDDVSGSIIVTLALPGKGAVALEVSRGSVTTASSGVHIAGDVTLDLGAARHVPLAAADLQLAVSGGGMPVIQGRAEVSGMLLDGLGCGCDDALLPAAVALDLSAALPNSDAPAALRLELAVPELDLDTAELPASPGILSLVDARVALTTDGCVTRSNVTGTLGAGTSAWTSVVPLEATGDLTASLERLNDSLDHVALQGGLALKGGALLCDSTPLVSLDLLDAAVTLDRQGASLSATTTVSVHPGLALTGEALITGEFTERDWSLRVCGGVLTGLLGGVPVLGDCWELGDGGVTPCRLPMH